MIKLSFQISVLSYLVSLALTDRADHHLYEGFLKPFQTIENKIEHAFGLDGWYNTVVKDADDDDGTSNATAVTSSTTVTDVGAPTFNQ